MTAKGNKVQRYMYVAYKAKQLAETDSFVVIVIYDGYQTVTFLKGRAKFKFLKKGPTQ